jgi:uncharacterized protein (DUF58 family)
MLVKLYTAAWALTILATVVLFATGNMGNWAVTVLGFIYFALLFGGIISVIPSTVFHGEPHKH